MVLSKENERYKNGADLFDSMRFLTNRMETEKLMVDTPAISSEIVFRRGS